MNQYVLLTFLCLLGWTGISAKEASRADDFFPKGFPSLTIEPHIPNNYKLVQPIVDDDNFGFFWSPEGVVEALLENSDIPHPPIIHVNKLVGVRSQKELKDYLEEYKNLFPDGYQSANIKWGPHAVVTVTGYFGSHDLSCLAFVCLDDPNGNFYMFQLTYSKELDFGNGSRPAPEDLKFWEDFLKFTH